MSSLQTWSRSPNSADAPPPFTWQGKTVVPVEFKRLDLSLTVDVPAKQGIGRARIPFTVTQRGAPLMDMVPPPTRLELDGRQLAIDAFPEAEPPNGEAKVRVLDVELEPGEEHVLTIDYGLAPATLSFGNGGAQLAFFMNDLDDREYLEQHAPANLEFDQHPTSVDIRLLGAAREHQLFSNGSTTPTANGWSVQFPSYFASSSHYLHLTDRSVHVAKDRFQTGARSIPILAYAERANEANEAIRVAKEVIAELEADYGAYAHESLTIYITGDIDGGMEYCGATMTQLGALEHEITHSWFARGVMPGNGNSGWIDEAIASWRDYGYPSRAPNPHRAAVNLAAFPPYRRQTPDAAYREGALLLAEIDFLSKQGGGAGLRAMLRTLYAQKQHEQITTEFLKQFLETQSGLNLKAMFDRFVYNKGGPESASLEAHARGRAMTTDTIRELQSKAPHVTPHRRFTRAELNSLR
jgi:hypothetical protein